MSEPSEAELRAAWEEQLRRLTPADVVIQTAVSLISLAGRRLGVEPGTEDERDLEQVVDAIDGVRALMPLLERRESPEQLRPLRDAVAGLQMEYARVAAAAAPAAGGGEPPPTGAEGGGESDGGGGDGGPKAPPERSESGPGPAQRSGRLWVPGS